MDTVGLLPEQLPAIYWLDTLKRERDSMYTPSFNAEHDVPRLQHFVRANPLCTLVTETEFGMIASHVPMVLHDGGAGLGVLRGHVARANPQWRDFLALKEVLGIFTGPQHYISASWYPGKATHGKEVPTWNYVAVHVYGRLRALEESDWLLDHLRALTDASEATAETPWKVSDAPPEFIDELSRSIVGLELEVTRFEGKWKVSQNRSDRDAEGVSRGLTVLGTPASLAMRELVRERHPTVVRTGRL